MGYLRTSLARAQRPRSDAGAVVRHAQLRSAGRHEITTAWTTPGGSASPEVSASSPGLAAAPMTRTAEMVSEAPIRVQTAERQEHPSASSASSAPTIRWIRIAAPEVFVSARAQRGQAAMPAAVNARKEDSGTQPKTVALDLRERPRTLLPETSRRSTPVAPKVVERAAQESFAETQSETASKQTSLSVPAVRTEAVKAPVFHVNWVEENRSIPPAARERVEREVVLAARAEIRQRVEAAKAEPSPVEIRVEHLTVKIENSAPAAPAAPPTTLRSTPAGSAPDFSDYFLRRSISGF